MDRCVVLVDAGYLLGAAASLLAGEATRSRITVDHPALVQGLRERAEAETGHPLLRIYWFDGAPDRVPQPEHRRLRVMNRVTVRLGALTRADGRWAQKGVDAAMHAELSELARNRACSDVVLVTGDGDLLPGMMAAKEHGVAVHLWAVQAADGDFNQSEDLVAEADERRVLDRQWISLAIQAREFAPLYGAPPVGARPEIAAILSAPLPEAVPAKPAPTTVVSGQRVGSGAAGPQGVTKGVPTPKDLAGLAARAVTAPAMPAGAPAPAGPAAPTAPATPAAAGPGNGPACPNAAVLRWSSDKGWVERGPGGGPESGPELPTLAQLTTAEQRWADREEDITAVGGDPGEVGQVFAGRWITRLADQAQLDALSREYPRIPHRIDGELLRYAARFGLLAHKDDQIDERDRYAIRAGFWREVESRSAGSQEAVATPPKAAPASSERSGE